MIKQRYKIEREIGRGRFGVVFLVKDLQIDGDGEQLKVAKRISLGNELDNIQAILTEAQMLSRLDHENIIKDFDSFLEHNDFVIITEYCDGGDLKSKIKSMKQSGLRDGFSDRMVLIMFSQLIRAVEHVHQHSMIHRDITTGNVLLKNGIIKLGDFGSSRLLRNSLDTAQTVAGTPIYMSPEMLNLQDYDSKTDIWSCGCVLYEICTMETLFAVQGIVSLSREVYHKRIPHLPPQFSSELNSIFLRMMSLEPFSRPTASEILQNDIFKTNLAASGTARRRRRRRRRNFLDLSSSFSVARTEIDEETQMWFKELDENQNGSISSKEIRVALFKSGGKTFGDKAVAVFFDLFDVNDDDCFELDEFADIFDFIRRRRKEFEQAAGSDWGFLNAPKFAETVEKSMGYKLTQENIDLSIEKFGTVNKSISVDGYLLATAFFKLRDAKSNGRDFNEYVGDCLIDF